MQKYFAFNRAVKYEIFCIRLGIALTARTCTCRSATEATALSSVSPTHGAGVKLKTGSPLECDRRNCPFFCHSDG
jgi:hypothetical protein